ncbi:MAG TPA: hypothetical protein VK176_03280 [Phycisphaerales bacterium]|nr:hypothetical protein [Phycisphaerales bacterium]
MFCPKCSYNLLGIAARACPECGRTFDPADPLLHLTTTQRRNRAFARVIIVIAGSLAALYPSCMSLAPIIYWHIVKPTTTLGPYTPRPAWQTYMAGGACSSIVIILPLVITLSILTCRLYPPRRAIWLVLTWTVLTITGYIAPILATTLNDTAFRHWWYGP